MAWQWVYSVAHVAASRKSCAVGDTQAKHWCPTSKSTPPPPPIPTETVTYDGSLLENENAIPAPTPTEIFGLITSVAKPLQKKIY